MEMQNAILEQSKKEGRMTEIENDDSADNSVLEGMRMANGSSNTKVPDGKCL